MLKLMFVHFTLFIGIITNARAVSFVNIQEHPVNNANVSYSIFNQSNGGAIYGGYKGSPAGTFLYPTLSSEDSLGNLVWSYHYPFFQSIGINSLGVFSQILKPSNSGSGMLAFGSIQNNLSGNRDVIILNFDEATGAILSYRMIVLPGDQDSLVRAIELTGGGFALSVTTFYGSIPTSTLIKIGPAPTYNVMWVKEWGSGVSTVAIPIEGPNNRIMAFGQSLANPPVPLPSGNFENLYVMIVDSSGNFVKYRSFRSEPSFRHSLSNAIYDAATSSYYLLGHATQGVPNASLVRGSITKLNSSLNPIYYREFWLNNTNSRFTNFGLKKNQVSGKLNFSGSLNDGLSTVYGTIGEIDPATGIVTDFKGFNLNTSFVSAFSEIAVLNDGSVRAAGSIKPTTSQNVDNLNIKTDSSLNFPCFMTNISTIISSANYPIYFRDFIVSLSSVSTSVIFDTTTLPQSYSLNNTQACFAP